MTKKEAIEYYNSLEQTVRIALNEEFGQHGIPDRETKFYKWLAKRGKNENSRRNN